MQAEIEAKFLDIDIDAMRAKLQAAGAVCEQPMRLMRRVVADVPKHLHVDAFLRVRDEGHKVTITYKQFDELSVDGAKEIEITVDDFDRARQLIEALGYKARSYQESRRETWKLGDAEIVVDEWPWLKPYIEIEAHDKETLQKTAEKLGLKWETAAFGDVMVAYRGDYPHLSLDETVGDIAEVRFDDPLPDMLKNSTS